MSARTNHEMEVTVLLAVICRHQMTPRQDFLQPRERQPIRRTVVRPPRPRHDRDREPQRLVAPLRLEARRSWDRLRPQWAAAPSLKGGAAWCARVSVRRVVGVLKFGADAAAVLTLYPLALPQSRMALSWFLSELLPVERPVPERRPPLLRP